MKSLLLVTCFLVIFYQISFAQNNRTKKQIEVGLDYIQITASKKSIVGDSKISIIRIDPKKFRPLLFNAKELNDEKHNIDVWAKKHNLKAAINAGMFQADQKTNVGYMQNFEFINSRVITKGNAVLAFNRKDYSVPIIQIIDRQCQDFKTLKTKYNTLIQGIRMIDCNQKNKWSQQDKKWSTAAVGVDKKGNLLFMFTRSPFTVHDFVDIILKADLDIKNAMYLEGGPEASFYLNHKGTEIKKMGSYETGFFESDENKEFWPIPNVIGVEKK